MPDPLWRLEEVVLPGRARPRLDRVSLRLGGGITGVLGASGAGKTSLLNVLVGFERPARGRCTFAPPPAAGAPPLFWCPADGGLWPHLSVHAHLAAVHPRGGAEAAAAARGWLDAFGLTDVAGQRPARLSTGQQQRLALARALATEAPALVLDEPLAHVDGAAARRCEEVLREHARRHAAAVVLAAHDPATVLALCERVVCLQDGRVVWEGEVDALHERPPTEALARALGEANWLSPEQARTWLGVEPANGRAHCYRPHRVEVALDDAAPFVVVASACRGATAEVVLRDLRTGATARFVHRPPARPLRAGVRVALRVCAALALLWPNACAPPAARARPLSALGARHHAMPPCGPRVPAPRAVAPGRGGEWLVLDNAGRVLVFGPDGALRRSWSMPAHQIGNPEGVLQLRDGRIAVADTHYHRVVFFDAAGTVVGTLGGPGEGPGQFGYPVRLAEDDRGHLYVAEYGGNDRVQKFARDGTFVLAFGRCGTGPGELQRPSGLAWRDGLVWVADAMNHRIHVFGDDGRHARTLAAGAVRLPYDVDVADDGRVWVVEYGGGCLTALSPDGAVAARYGTPGSGAENLATPWAFALGPGGRAMIADTGNRRLVEVRP